jgi:lysophospholipase L1-like esterase
VTEASITYKNEWVLEYNKAATDLMESKNVLVNDIYSLMLSGPKYYKCEDMLHLSDQGYKKCAESIAEMIRKELK